MYTILSSGVQNKHHRAMQIVRTWCTHLTATHPLAPGTWWSWLMVERVLDIIYFGVNCGRAPLQVRTMPTSASPAHVNANTCIPVHHRNHRKIGDWSLFATSCGICSHSPHCIDASSFGGGGRGRPAVLWALGVRSQVLGDKSSMRRPRWPVLARTCLRCGAGLMNANALLFGCARSHLRRKRASQPVLWTFHFTPTRMQLNDVFSDASQ